MSDILFLTLDDPAGAPADDYLAAGALPWPDADADAHADPDAHDAEAGDVECAARETRAGCAAARSGDWPAAAELLTASAHRRGALVATGRTSPTAAVRGWSDAAVLAAARDDVLGAADALARARALCADDTPGELLAALHDVTAWLGALGGAVAPVGRVDVSPEHEIEFASATVDVSDAWVELDTAAEWTSASAAEADASETVADDLVFLSLDEEPLSVAASNVAEPAVPTPLAYLDLEGPVRPWERTHTAPATDIVPEPVVVVAPSGRTPIAGPLVGPLAPALRNAKIDEAVALATAPSIQSPGRLRTLLGRLRRK